MLPSYILLSTTGKSASEPVTEHRKQFVIPQRKITIDVVVGIDPAAYICLTDASASPSSMMANHAFRFFFMPNTGIRTGSMICVGSSYNYGSARRPAEHKVAGNFPVIKIYQCPEPDGQPCIPRLPCPRAEISQAPIPPVFRRFSSILPAAP